MAKTGGEPPKILDVGQCDYDHRRIAGFLADRFGAKVDRAHGLDDARGLLEKERYGLVLVNRLLDADQFPGVDVIRSLKDHSDPGVSGVPIMMVSNFADAQQAAVEAGAEPGFGKAELDKEATVERLSALLN
ncbi:response regulator transcription factor [Paludisphaera soli]|uniref:response regulator transcription factor n=1 Tax=Paludisphaera soli TaxID=2712865 RepID=UPI0013E9A60F|nr:response regulator transcription factor [Paludisphaera soli]